MTHMIQGTQNCEFFWGFLQCAIWCLYVEWNGKQRAKIILIQQFLIVFIQDFHLFSIKLRSIFLSIKNLTYHKEQQDVNISMKLLSCLIFFRFLLNLNSFNKCVFPFGDHFLQLVFIKIWKWNLAKRSHL